MRTSIATWRRGIFFQRVEWVPSAQKIRRGAGAGEARAAAEFQAFAASLGMVSRVVSSTHRARGGGVRFESRSLFSRSRACGGGREKSRAIWSP